MHATVIHKAHATSPTQRHSRALTLGMVTNIKISEHWVYLLIPTSGSGNWFSVLQTMGLIEECFFLVDSVCRLCCAALAAGGERKWRPDAGAWPEAGVPRISATKAPHFFNVLCVVWFI